MTLTISSHNARALSNQDFKLYDEISIIERAIIESAVAGNRSVVISDGTSMTNSSPIIKVIGSETNPITEIGDTLILNDETFALGATGINLNSIIADINDQNIPGVLASKTEDNKLELTYTSVNGVWQFNIGAGTANSDLGINAGLIQADNPESADYYAVWKNFTNNRKLQEAMNTVINSVKSKGFNIYQRTNLITTNTFEWVVEW